MLGSKTAIAALVVATGTVLASCMWAKSSAGPDDHPDDFATDISGVWRVDEDPGHEFVLDPDVPGTARSGAFRGEEHVPDGAGGFSAFAVQGSYEGSAVTLTVSRTAGPTTLTGRFLSQVAMQLQVGSESLLLLR